MNNIINTVTIVGNGEDYSVEKLKFYSKKSDFIIASDGGLKILAECNIKPDLIIGDFDSVNSETLNSYHGVEIIKFPPEKDFTDSELSIQKALELNPEVINLFGVTGSYFDHSLANIFNLLKYGNNSEINIINKNSIIFLIKKSRIFENLKNRRISFFPIDLARGLKLKGFKYTFDKTDIHIPDYSVSNTISENYAEIIFSEGHLICILFDEGYI